MSVAEPARSAAHPRGAVLVMPRRSTEWSDAAAMWITAAGWAEASRKRFGRAWVVTPDAVASPEQTVAYTQPRPRGDGSGGRGVARFLPEVVKTALKDGLRAWEARTYRDVGDREWCDTELAFVWQHHDLFHRAGEPLAERRGCPLVAYVHAPQVWEAARWGVHRPGWGGALERYGERPQLVHSDVVACVSDEVAAQVVRMGVTDSRVLVSPMAVDADRFSPSVSGAAVRDRLGLGDAFVVGWTGSFRKFHGLELAVEALARVRRDVPRAKLMLVGDGFERANVEAEAARLNVSDAVVLPGAVAHDEIPDYVAAMDVALVTARAGQEFHYSPLKMREYLAAGVPVVAPQIGEIPDTITDGVTGRLYPPGDAAGLGAVLRQLFESASERAAIGRAGREYALARCTWDAQLGALLDSAAFAAATRRPQAR